MTHESAMKFRFHKVTLSCPLLGLWSLSVSPYGSVVKEMQNLDIVHLALCRKTLPT
jgi:hypothetical protein